MLYIPIISVVVVLATILVVSSSSQPQQQQQQHYGIVVVSSFTVSSTTTTKIRRNCQIKNPRDSNGNSSSLLLSSSKITKWILNLHSQQQHQQHQQSQDQDETAITNNNNDDDDVDDNDDKSIKNSSNKTDINNISTSTSSSTSTTAPKIKIIVDEQQHDAEVMNRLLRPYQITDLLSTFIQRVTIFLVGFSFLLQYFGYSYIFEYDSSTDEIRTNNDGSTTLIHKKPPTIRIGTIEERDFMKELQRR